MGFYDILMAVSREGTNGIGNENYVKIHSIIPCEEASKS